MYTKIYMKTGPLRVMYTKLIWLINYNNYGLLIHRLVIFVLFSTLMKLKILKLEIKNRFLFSFIKYYKVIYLKYEARVCKI